MERVGRRSPNRYQRRKHDRGRPARPPRPKRSIPTRIAFFAGGTLLVVGGIALLASGSAAGTNRLFRVEGVLIVVGACAMLAGVFGW